MTTKISPGIAPTKLNSRASNILNLKYEINVRTMPSKTDAQATPKRKLISLANVDICNLIDKTAIYA